VLRSSNTPATSRFKWPRSPFHARCFGRVRHDCERGRSRWRACLVETPRQFHGSAWTTGLEAEWNAAIDLASQIRLQGYQARLKFE